MRPLSWISVRNATSVLITGLIGTCAMNYATNETPRWTSTILFQPCEWHIGDVAGPLLDLSGSQHYAYTHYTNTTVLADGTVTGATLDSAFQLNSKAIVHFVTHGSRFGDTVIECYRPADEAKGLARFRDICNGTITPGGLRLTCDGLTPDVATTSVGHEEATADPNRTRWVVDGFGIMLTKAGMKRVFHPSPHTIIFNGACNGVSLGTAFGDQVEYFAYANCTGTDVSKVDMRTLLERLAGTELAGHARSVGGHDLGGKPAKTCSAFGFGGFSDGLRHSGPGNTTVAPAVDYRNATHAAGCKDGGYAFQPQNTVLRIGNGYAGSVSFDTVMDQFRNPTDIVQTQGCAAFAGVPPRWTGDHTIEFDLMVPNAGSHTLTLVNTQAISEHNGRELDGNQVPQAQSGVGPNRDDYKANNTCFAGFRRGPGVPTVAVDVMAGLTATVIDSPVGIGGASPVDGWAEVSSTGGVFGLAFAASDLVSGGQMISGTQVSFSPSLVDLAAGEVMPILIFVSVPPGQPSGNYTGTLTASDGGLNTTTFPITVHINNPPVFDLPESITAIVGIKTTVPLRATDAEGDAIAFSANMLPVDAEFFDNGNGTGVVEFTPDAALPGNSVISVGAVNSDIPGKPSTWRTISVTVLGGRGGVGADPRR
jgi:hypothetical protein